MEKNHVKRQTVFLYPTAQREHQKSFLKITQLVTDLKSIIRRTNKFIEHLLCETCFSRVKCIPSVEMQCIANTIKEIYNIRICVVQYEEEDYTENYSDVIDAFKNNTSDISHLVALKISSEFSKINFSKDDRKNFDAIIETNLENLDTLLLAIMLDISLYHYFGLSRVLSKRKEFNKNKYVYLFEKYDVCEIYGSSLTKNSHIYLPFSLSKANEIYFHEAEDLKEKEIIDNLIQEFSNFIISKYTKQLTINENGNLRNADSTYDSESLQQFIREHKKDFVAKSRIIFVPRLAPTENDTIFMVEYNSSTSSYISWAEKLSENVSGYHIFSVKVEE